MTTFPNSPRLLKGAIVGVDVFNPLASVILFQYNPDTLARRLEARAMGGGEGSDRSEAFRLTGPPKEAIDLSVEVDAADQLERTDPLAVSSGVYPALSALEMLLTARYLGDPEQSWRLCDANAVVIQALKLENEGWERDLDVVEPAEPTFTEPPA